MFFGSIVIFILFICVYNANNRIRDLEKENKRLKQEILLMKREQNGKVAVSDSVNREVTEEVQTQLSQKTVVK